MCVNDVVDMELSILLTLFNSILKKHVEVLLFSFHKGRDHKREILSKFAKTTQLKKQQS